MTEQLSVNMLVSETFDLKSTPLIIATLKARGHKVNPISEGIGLPPDHLLDCDVFIDRSSIVSVDFFRGLAEIVRRRREDSLEVPLMIDEPNATTNSLDKRRTHQIMPDLVPESYNLDGLNNESHIKRFIDDAYVVIKDPFGWYARGIDRLSPLEALKKYRQSKDLIVQKFVPFSDGIGRILTLNYGSRFEIVCAYLRIPDSWRTGEGTTSEFQQVEIDDELYSFAHKVSHRSGLYLNGIDYIFHDGKYVLLEVNAVPGIQTPYYNLGIDSPGIFVKHIEESVS